MTAVRTAVNGLVERDGRYTEFWRFALVTGFGWSALYAYFGLNTYPIERPGSALVLWAVALLIAAVVANYESVLARLP